jgi:hypothetical protein
MIWEDFKMGISANREVYDVKFEQILEGNAQLSVTDVLWLDNLAYFRNMHLEYHGSDDPDSNIREYLSLKGANNGGNFCF